VQGGGIYTLLDALTTLGMLTMLGIGAVISSRMIHDLSPE